MANYYHLKGRRGTASAWASANPTPADGEICIETDTGKIKIGDGVTAYTALSYFTLPTATTSAAGLMSAADKSKLNGITISLYAKIASPAFTGTPTAPTAADGSVNTQIATTEFVAQQVARALPYAVRCEYTAATDGEYQVINDINYCTFMALNGQAVKVAEKQKLVAGTNYIDFVFCISDLIGYNTIPDNAFADISELTRAILPDFIFRIGDSAFMNSGLSELWVLSDTPPTLGSSAFDNTGIAGGGTVYVQKDHDALYQSSWGGVGCTFDTIQ